MKGGQGHQYSEYCKELGTNYATLVYMRCMIAIHVEEDCLPGEGVGGDGASSLCVCESVYVSRVSLFTHD